MDPVSPTEQIQTPILAPNKKYVLLAFGVIAVIVLFLIITVITSTTAKKPAVTSGTVRQTNNNPGSKNVDNSNSAENTPVAEKWKTYKNSLFSIDYPLDWKTEEIKLPNGAMEVKLYPINNPDFINMVVLAESIASIPSLSEKEQSFAKTGFKKEDAMIDSLQAIKLIGVFPPANKSVTQSANKYALQMRHVYLDRGNYSYLFDYWYLGSGTNIGIESTIDKIITTFKFTN